MVTNDVRRIWPVSSEVDIQSAAPNESWRHMIHRGAIILLLIAIGALPVSAQDFGRTAAGISDRLISSGKRSVAVVDFTDLQMNVTELGRYLAEEFQSAIVMQATGYKVIDRTHIKAILQENKLSSTGLIDPQSARQLGRIAGVESLITASITPLGDNVHLSIKLLDASTAEGSWAMW
jgi:TolB-like protein